MSIATNQAASAEVQLRNEVSALRKDQRNLHSFMHIAATYALLAGGFWVLHQHPGPAAYVGCFFFIGLMQYRLVMSTHEATHKNLFFPVWLNEFFGVFHSALMGISFFNYRRTHLEHHKNPQSIDEDIDSYIYRPLLEAKPGLPRLSLLVFGVFVDLAEKILRKLRGARRRAGEVPAVKNASSLPAQLWPILLCHAGLIWFFWTWFHWWYYIAFWMAPVMLVAVGLDRARTFAEHGYQYIFSDQTWEDFKHAPQSTIDIDTNGLERFLFAPFGFAYHQAHHTQLTVPYYNLHKLADLLEARKEGYYRRIRGSYVGILLRMIWGPK